MSPNAKSHLWKRKRSCLRAPLTPTAPPNGPAGVPKSFRPHRASPPPSRGPASRPPPPPQPRAGVAASAAAAVMFSIPISAVAARPRLSTRWIFIFLTTTPPLPPPPWLLPGGDGLRPRPRTSRPRRTAATAYARPPATPGGPTATSDLRSDQDLPVSRPQTPLSTTEERLSSVTSRPLPRPASRPGCSDRMQPPPQQGSSRGQRAWRTPPTSTSVQGTPWPTRLRCRRIPNTHPLHREKPSRLPVSPPPLRPQARNRAKELNPKHGG